MLTATGFIVMWVAAGSTCTAHDGESPPRPWVAAPFDRCTHRSAVPPTPTPTMVGGQVLPPASSTQSITKVLTASIPSAGIAILSHELFSEPPPLGIISLDSVSGGATKSRG